MNAPLRQRVLAMAAGYGDLSDRDELRFEPAVLKCGRFHEAAGQPVNQVLAWRIEFRLSSACAYQRELMPLRSLEAS